MKTEDKTILITGAARGIGRYLALHFKEVVQEIIAIDVDELNLDTLKKEGNNRVACYLCNVCDYNQVSDTINNIFKNHQKVDILVNNAGWIYSAPLINMLTPANRKHDPELWRKVIDANLNSVFNVTSCVVDKMIERRIKGLIINVSTISAKGMTGQSAYAAAKSGVNALTSAWCKELAVYGIRCAAYAPGLVDSPSMDEALTESHVKSWIKTIPSGRFCSMDEIFKTVKYIIENDYFNGKVLPVDGGLTV